VSVEASAYDSRNLTPSMEDRMEHKDHPAEPEQTRHGFEEGLERTPDTPAEEVEGDFAVGQEREGETPEKEMEDRFSRGQEADDEKPEKEREGRFSTGQDHGPPPHDR
jgi:hypothetical protein